MPLSQEQLESLAEAEGDRSEFKESLADRDNVKRAICAFANDLADHRSPGVVYVGLRDDGSCAGLTITEDLEKRVADFRSDGSILPMISVTPRRVRVRGCDVLAIEVEPSQTPPVRLAGVVWVRSGPTNQKATPEEERRLSERVRWHAVPFDLRPVPGASLADLELSLFERVYLPRAVAPEVLTANSRSTEQQLAALRLATVDGRPTFAGILVLGKDVRQWLPGAYVQFLRIDGTNLTDSIRDQKVIDGPLPDLLRRLDDLIELNVTVPTQIIGPAETRRPDYPVEALRQLARNLIMHRTYDGTNAPARVYWYSDRIEFHNPGGPFGQVSRENFGQPGVTDYRNPQLAESMRVLGFVQRFGAGIPIAQRELEKNGNPPVEFRVDATRVVAIVRRSV